MAKTKNASFADAFFQNFPRVDPATIPADSDLIEVPWPPTGASYRESKYTILIERAHAGEFIEDHRNLVNGATEAVQVKFRKGPRQRADKSAKRTEFIHKLRTEDQITRWVQIKKCCVEQGLAAENVEIKTLMNGYSRWLRTRPR